MNAQRADYAPSRQPDVSPACVTEVTPGGPADRAGVKVGDRVLTVNGLPLRDHVDWLWESDDGQIELMISAVDLATDDVTSGELGTLHCGFSDELVPKTLEREWGEDWGLAFDRAVFDGMRTCVNACTFCFMSMLPKGEDRMREALYVRDDDYRLSFMQGNFVTLTNTTDADIDRIIDYNLAPLHISVHATDPDLRERIIGKNQQRGLVALAELLQAGVELHAQIVLMPDTNDGAQLQRTLDDLLAYNNVLSVGIVPLGYTRYQDRFTSSYSDDPARAKAVIDQVTPIQEAQRAKTGRARVYLADEFYVDAKEAIPPHEAYDDFPQYEDGIGMIRSFYDEVEAVDDRERQALVHALTGIADHSIPSQSDHADQGRRIVLITGELFAPYLFRGLETLTQEMETVPLVVRPVKNEFFGGNVDVTGLLTGADITKSLAGLSERDIALIPDIILNDDHLTLDDYTVEDLRTGSLCDVRMVSCNLTGIIRGILDAAATLED